jgi:hypothetical protein
MLDVCVVLLSDNHASTAVGPIEVFDGAGVLWNTLMGEALDRRFRGRGRRRTLSPAPRPAGLDP